MAKVTVNAPPPVQQPPRTYTLELSEKEAQFLYDALAHVNGNSPGDAWDDPVYSALVEAGLDYTASVEPDDFGFLKYKGTF